MKRTVLVALVLVGMICAVLLWQRLRAPLSNSPALAPAATTAIPDNLGADVLAAEKVELARTATTSVSNRPISSHDRLIALLTSGTNEPPRISREQAEAFAAANGRSADALLAAWRASGDSAFLREAMEKHSDDPRVAYMAWCKAGLNGDDAGAAKARREWLDKFKQAAPENALADYLSARARLKTGDLDGALNELAGASGKAWRDYTADSIQNTEEAYRSAGFSEAESKAIAAMGALLPHLSELRGLGKSLNEIAGARRDAGDTASADAALQWALQIGERTSREGTPTLIQELVAVAIQKDALKGLNPNSAIGESGMTVQQRLETLEQQRKVIRDVARQSGDIMPRLSEPELATYFDRMKLFGEAAAVNWAKGRLQQN